MCVYELFFMYLVKVWVLFFSGGFMFVYNLSKLVYNLIVNCI